jgi:hypothetical protein
VEKAISIVADYGVNPAKGSVEWTLPADLEPGDYYTVEISLSTGEPGNESNIAVTRSAYFSVSNPAWVDGSMRR